MKALEEMTYDELVAFSVKLTGWRVRAQARGARVMAAVVRAKQLEVNQWITARSASMTRKGETLVRPRMI